MTALEHNRSDEIIQALIGLNDVNHRCKVGFNALKTAIVQQNMSACRFLIEAGADVNKTGMDGATALTIAATMADSRIVSLLIQSGADTKASQKDRFGRPQRTALQLAASNGNLGNVMALLNAGVGPNQTTSDAYQTPLYYARRNKHKEVAELLVQRGASDPNDVG